MTTAVSLAAINFNWLPILPLLIITVGAMVVLLVGVNVSDRDSEGLGWLSLVAIALAVATSFLLLGTQQVTFSGALVADNYTAFFYVVILLAAAVIVLMSLDYVPEEGLPGAEYYALVLFATAGMMLMAAAGDLIIVFLGLETMSISVYILAGLARTDVRSNEAALKYFLLGAFSTGFLLYGIALIYGATGTIKLQPLTALIAGGGNTSPMLLLGVGLLLIGFGFKVAAVPFHMWTPDVYEGAPTSVTAFMAVGVKLASFAAFLRVFMVHLLGVQADWSMVLWVLAVLTMTTGNIVALMQTNLKRMMAYSAIAHAGYILVAMTAGSSAAGAAILYYLLGYAFTNLGAFAVIIAMGRRGHPHETIADLRGLSTREPALAGAMAIMLFSLTGVPPLAGFVGKFSIFSAALSSGYVWLVVIAVLNSVTSVYYYLRPIVAMYTDTGGAEVVRMRSRPALIAAIAIAVIATIMIGIYPQPYMAASTNAFASAFGKPPLATTASLRP
ncbi:MAG TPA: NADH-quinone oxidoreductase subunit N [Candidatus Binataceae bacterium]|jgi:NADH-quinone oxidoreductase subunit N|nr:NADH-quinone oxidoreductase subunit N [Candidatus Binataceae bacterium]